MQAGGLTPEQSLAQLNRLVDQQAFMLSANDVFYVSALIFLLLIAVVWLARPVKGSARAVKRLPARTDAPPATGYFFFSQRATATAAAPIASSASVSGSGTAFGVPAIAEPQKANGASMATMRAMYMANAR